ncbi:hypothetical protein QZM22_06460 [Burkholderia oklahomensis]|nr:hypothetical protein [Burkholderia oklahomensis]
MDEFPLCNVPHAAQPRLIVRHELCKPVLAEIDVDRARGVKPRAAWPDPIVLVVADTHALHLLFDFVHEVVPTASRVRLRRVGIVLHTFRQPEEDSRRRASQLALCLDPNQIARQFRRRVGQRVINVEVLPESAPVDDPHEIAVERFAGSSLGVGHSGMLHFDNDACRCLDVRPMDFTVRRDVRNCSAVGRKQVFPFAMPRRFVLPPRITVAAADVRPMMHDARAAFRDGCHAACRANALTARKRLAALAFNDGELHLLSPSHLISCRN